MAYKVASITDVGIKRKVNQDSICYRTQDTDKGVALMAIVCDGMGGLAEGEVASRMVVENFEQWFSTGFVTIVNQSAQIDSAVLQKELEDLVVEQNEKLVAYGQERDIQVGTTLSALFVVGDRYFTVHVGDSRIYGLTYRKLLQLTNDHSVVAEEVRKGIITAAQAQTDKRRNILMQCVGVRKGVKPEFSQGRTVGCVSFLLCSDGFVHKVSGEEIWKSCNPKAAIDTEQMNKLLYQTVEMLKSRQETDNISAVLVQVNGSEGGIVQ